MNKTLGLSIVLGASLAAGFSPTVGQSVKQLNRIGDSLKTLEGRRTNITQFKAIATDVRSTSKAYGEAQEKVQQLAREIGATERPTNKQAKAFKVAKKEASDLKKKLDEKRASLRSVSSSMRTVGQATSGLRQQQVQLGQTVDSLRAKHTQLNRAIGDRKAIEANRSAMRSQMLDVVALGATMLKPITSAASFEDAMADVRKVIDFETPQQFAMMGKDIRRLATTEIPMAAGSIAQIVSAAGRAGIARSELLPFASDAAKVGVAWELAAQQAGGGLTGLRSIFQLNQEQVMLLADSFNHLDNNMDTTAADLLNIANRAGPTGRLMGLTGAQVGALGATFRALKTPPQVAANSMNAFFNRLATADRQGAKFKASLESIGWTATDLKDAVKDDAQGAILEFLTTLEGAEDVQGILTDMFGLEYADDIAKLVGGLDLYREALGHVADKTRFAGSVDKEFNTRRDTTINNWRMFKNQSNEVAIVLGSVLLPATNEVMGAVGSLMNVVGDVADAGGSVTTVVVGAAVSLVGLKIAAIGAGYAWTFVAGTVATARTIWAGTQLAILWTRVQLVGFNATALITAARMRLMNVSAIASGFTMLAGTVLPAVTTGIRVMGLAMMANPVGFIVGGIALAAGLVIANWDKVKTFFGGMWDGIKNGWTTFNSWLGTAIKYSPIGLLVSGVRTVASLFSDTPKVGNAVKAKPVVTVASNTQNSEASNLRQTEAVKSLSRPANDTNIPHYQVAGTAARQAQAEALAVAQQPAQVNLGGVVIHATQRPGESTEEFARRVKDELVDTADTALHDVE